MSRVGLGWAIPGLLALCGCGEDEGQPARGSIVTPPRERDSAAGSTAESSKASVKAKKARRPAS